MSLRRHLVPGIVLALVLLAIVAFAATRESNAPEALPEAPPTATSSPESATTPRSEPAPVELRTAIVREPAPASDTVALKAAVAPATAALVVDGTRYGLTAPEGATLKEALDRLDAESDFSYAYRSYAGLGAFVTTINGRASGSDTYWILYVNGEKSGTGISATRIRSNDVIEWKLEKSY